MSLECLCVKKASSAPNANGGILRAKISCSPACVRVVSTAVGSIIANGRRERGVSATLTAAANIKNKASATLRLGGAVVEEHPVMGYVSLIDATQAIYYTIPDYATVLGKRFTEQGVFTLIPGLTLSAAAPAKLLASASLTSSYTDKFAGDFNDFGCYQKLYPTSDVTVELNGSYFVDENLSASDIYDSIDEGVFIGNYHTNEKISRRLVDDRSTYIQPSAIHTDGNFRYKCGVTKPSVTPHESRIYIRASAPRANYGSQTPPRYTLSNIKLEDPSGNTIIHYNDIVFRGDADYENIDDVNFATYGSSPKTNNTLKNDWHTEYPFMQESAGYTLNIDLNVEALDDPFNRGFNVGYDDENELYVSSATNQDYLALDGSPLSTRIQNFSLNPTNTIRISAIEICNSGAYDTAVEHYLPIHLGVEATGRRIERCILPSMMPTYGFSGVYPAVSSIWYDNSLQYSNQSGIGANILTGALRSNHAASYITMSGTSPSIPDSGKLFLKFSHEAPEEVFAYRGGEFNISHSFNEFNVARANTFKPDDHFFVVDSISLKVRARKAVGSRDYALDLVGWSDDKLLHVTPATGGFLQNTSGYGTIPTTSGFSSTNEFALDGEPFSDQDQYFQTDQTNNDGGDHYLLDLPKVTGTLFEWYEIPLTVYEDRGTLGKYKDYNTSSYFEHLYVDIYPIPSGASIKDIQLCIKYKPANALQLHILGADEIRRITKDRSEGKIYPSIRQTNDDIVNAGSGYAALSTIENIPHAYRTPSGIKSNYSRRWRGLEGVVQGPFDPDMFGFGFSNPLLDFPFPSGFYDFDYDDGLTIKSRPLGATFGDLTGTMTTTYTDHHLKNIGWRFNTSGIFGDQLAGYSSPYRTTDWTALSNGTSNFKDHELYGNIADAFNNVIRISGQNSNVNFGHIDTVSGFSVYVRFTPDANISGVDYNLFDSGVLVSKWDTGNDLEFALAYDEGYLCGYAKDKDDNIITVKDTVSYSGYQYPLSVLLTYNDKNASGLKLYTDNELHSGVFNTLRGSSSAFYKKAGSSNVVLGYSSGSGVGMNMFVSEFALGTYHDSGAHIVEAEADITFKEITAESFLAGNRVKFWASGEPSTNDRYKLWDYINEDTLKWDLGAFKFCEFSADFDWFTVRSGRDLIHHNLNHDGSGYSRRTNLQLPSSIKHSDISYHTQIENDFLRFNLSDASDNFHSANPRISKSVPRGYKFSDRSLVVETVLEHDTYNDIVWSNGKVGPKLIVSLYTKNQDPVYTTENWGLINRAIHYLKPSGCWRRIDSTFTYDNMFDESEPWALFPNERRFTEFDHKYYSQDIDDMFLQYDLVYPSGPAFESRINIHSAHVRLEDAFVVPTDVSGQINLTTSGEKRERENLPLYSLGLSGINNLWGPGVSGLSLFTEFNPTTLGSGMSLYTSGNISASGFYLPLFMPAPLYNLASGIDLYTSGAYRVDNWGETADGVHYRGFPLFLNQTGISNIPSGGNIPLHLHGVHFGTNGLYRHMPLFLYNSLYSRIPGLRDNLPSGLTLSTIGRDALKSDFAYANNLSLFLKAGGVFGENMPLVLYGEDNVGLQNTQSLQLHTINFLTGTAATTGSSFMRWDGYSFGKKIDISDNIYSSLTADNEIRGVDLICYGACDASGDEGGRCNDLAIYTHDTLWRPETCTDGGIFRAHATYTNITASGFGPSWYGDGISPSANYYGIRKYDGLFPGGAYDVTIRGRTGTNNHIELPPEWEEWEYGSTDTVNFSGIKFIGDYPYLSGQRSLSAISGRITGDKYGKDVAVKGDLMVVGAPYHQFDEKGGTTFLEDGTTSDAHLVWKDGSGITNAGATFVYRRDPAPLVHGSDLHRGAWQLETKLVLPSAFRADYFLNSPGKVSLGGLPAIPVRKWKVGQEGRELGYSVDLSVSTKRKSLYEDTTQIIVAGAPGAKWLRTFDSVTTSGVKVAVIVFTDEFRYSGNDGEAIASKIEEQNWVYKYYSSGIAPDNHTVHLELDVIVCQSTGIFGTQNTAGKKELAKFIHHKKIGRKYGATDLEIFNGIKNAFLEVYPHDNTLTHSGIPPIVGMYVDDSRSLGRSDLEPAIDMFKDFYRDYSRASGVQDFYGVVSTGHMYELYPTDGAAEDWVGMSTKLIDELVDTGRLIADDGLRFITGGIGLEFANPELTEFNITPPSGGRVYVFEKESGSWNLIQEIVTSNESETTFSDTAYEIAAQEEDYFPDHRLDPMAGNQIAAKYDRFGHSVAISDNGEVITIGSPYMEDCCLVYEHDSSEKTRMYEGLEGWLTEKQSDLRYRDLLEKLARFTIPHGALTASKMIYAELTPSEKFDFRSDEIYWGNNIITEYRKIYKYGYGNIPHLGSWQFIPGTFGGTSRLGYSTTVSEDGNIVAFGAPTDSFNEWDDSNIWYKNYNTWADYTNAGAVRLFESRAYHPHSGVVEFTKFGNLDRSINLNQYPERYDDLELAFRNASTPFARTSFADVEIPKMAGTAFIITPEVDAASDEIVENIKDWMALGDRTLVLVGNDPVWEDNGRYEKSNAIINKILDKLDSRMRLHPARNEYESLPDCTPSGKPNVLASFVPWGSRGTTYQIHEPIYAKGVADIRMHLPKEWPWILHSPCDNVNYKCEMPLRHDGDLRAEWASECMTGHPDCLQLWKYATNWPWHFASTPNDCLECVGETRLIKQPYEEPRPLMVAAEYLPPTWTVYPPFDTTSGGEPIYKKVYVPPGPNNITYTFADRSIDHVEFGWSGGGGVYNSLTLGNFFDPDPFGVTDQDGNSMSRDAVLQAKGSLKESHEMTYKKKQVADDSIFAAEEKWAANNTSKVVVIAGLTPESERMLSFNYDYNISFYQNLVMADCITTGSIVQLGGWTNKISFEDAYEKSLLQKLFFFKGHDIIENWTGDIPESFNVCWIANPHGTPSEAELTRIETWLNTGNKTLVITYPNMTVPADEPDGGTGWTLPDQAIARNTYIICSGLGVHTRPLYLEGKGRFASRRLDSDVSATGLALNSGTDPRNTADWDSTIITGCEEKERVKEFYVDGGEVNSEFPEFIPLDLGGGVGYSANRIIHTDERVYDLFPDINDTSFWQIKSSIARLNVPVLPMSGYRLFYSWVSELPNEDHKIKMNLSKVYIPSCGDEQDDVLAGNPYPGNKKSGQPDTYKLYDYDQNDNKFLYANNVTCTKPIKGVFGAVQTAHMDLWVPSGVTNFDFYFDANDLKVALAKDHPGQPVTTRILSVSGCLLPINEILHIASGSWRNELIGHNPVVTTHHPAASSVVPSIFRPIMTDNTKYCDPESPVTSSSRTPYEEFIEDQLLGDGDPSTSPPRRYTCAGKAGYMIADGPMVIAEEPESFTAFPAGHKRSKIVLISDASIVQGDCHWYREEQNNLNKEEPNRKFIRSLYTPLGAMGTKDGAGTSDSNFGLQLDDGKTLQNQLGGRQFSHTAKLLAPDRGSPGKYFAASGFEGLRQRFNGAAYGAVSDLGLYDDDENVHDPRKVTRPSDPETEKERKVEINRFRGIVIPSKGAYPCFSGAIDGSIEYGDAGPGGGMPAIMIVTGKDYLDFDRFPSGYPGDLFGFALSMHSGKLVIGAPFNGFTGSGVHDWDEIKLTSSPVSGMNISHYGGAGAAYCWEKTGKGSGIFGEYLPWEFMQKLKPSGINIGHDNLGAVSSQDHFVLGPNEYQGAAPNDDFGQLLPITDRFGYDVSVHGDFVAIGAPGHNFENYHEHIFDRVSNGVVHSGTFLRKEFDFEFDIPLHNTYDLGTSGVRGTMPNSGLTVVNNGAVFTFQHKIVDWDNRTKEWTYAEKLVPQGYNARKQKEYDSDGGIIYLSASGTENDHFGSTVDINRARRADGDYTMVVGAPHHIFATSGDHPDSSPRLFDAGAAYTYDAMLRHQPPALASPDNWIIANLFGDTPSGVEPIRFAIQQNSTGNPIEYDTTGTVWANRDGEIFLEASGFDPVKKGFIENRCYIDLVYGQLRVGPQITGNLPLTIDGDPLLASSNMPLTMRGPSSALVYNSMGLYTPGVIAISGINVPSGLVLYMHSPDPIECSGIGFPTGSGLLFTVSGSHAPVEQLSLRIRGK